MTESTESKMTALEIAQAQLAQSDASGKQESSTPPKVPSTKTFNDVSNWLSMMEDMPEEEFLLGFNGLDQLQGDGEGWRQAVTWIESLSPSLVKKMASLGVLAIEKPFDLIATGRRKGVNVLKSGGVDGKYAKLLPKVPEGTNFVNDKGQLTRQDWGEWKNVNVRQTKRIGLILIEKRVKTKLVKDWIAKWGGVPSEVDKKGAAWKKLEQNEKSLKIMTELLDDFARNEDTWKKVTIAK